MFATSFSAYPLSFGHAGQAEAPEGKADVLDVKGAGNFTARLFIDSKTHLPLMLSWTTPPNLVPVVAGQKPPANLPPGSVTSKRRYRPRRRRPAEQKKQFEEDALAARKKAMASTTADREPHLLRRLSRCRWVEAAVPHPPGRWRDDGRGDDVRSLPHQRASRSDENSRFVNEVVAAARLLAALFSLAFVVTASAQQGRHAGA